jgi:hypothetical protein
MNLSWSVAIVCVCHCQSCPPAQHVWSLVPCGTGLEEGGAHPADTVVYGLAKAVWFGRGMLN